MGGLRRADIAAWGVCKALRPTHNYQHGMESTRGPARRGLLPQPSGPAAEVWLGQCRGAAELSQEWLLWRHGAHVLGPHPPCLLPNPSTYQCVYQCFLALGTFAMHVTGQIIELPRMHACLCCWRCLGVAAVWAGEPQVPSNITHTYTFFSYYPHIVSLGCPERLVVRAVLKLNRDIACPRLVTRAITSPQATNISLVTRCELVLPPGDEVEASVKSTEVNCKPCNDCASCPAKAGQWYSDTFSFSFGGCKSVLSSNTYEPVVPAIIMNNAASILLTKFEVQPDS
ncbi:uncharacterized protein HaLaN_14877 [Haematococcus lacustris]|uniref:Uncharacterized protein n=1 Tax=Haematococcus lacustris TaxID=44745 RepID=A0A699Z9N3_HAELA|nr:uncharacterized protein HaLaN_14877 [Haematococcus lacustris]